MWDNIAMPVQVDKVSYVELQSKISRYKSRVVYGIFGVKNSVNVNLHTINYFLTC